MFVAVAVAADTAARDWSTGWMLEGCDEGRLFMSDMVSLVWFCDAFPVRALCEFGRLDVLVGLLFERT